MLIVDYVEHLRVDLEDADKKLFSDSLLSACITNAVPRLARDLAIGLGVVEASIIPEITPEEHDMLLLLAQMGLCQVMQTHGATAFVFSSGDKRIDKTSIPKQWSDLGASLTAEYQRRLATIRPDAQLYADGYVITPGCARPVLTERGSGLRGPIPVLWWAER